MDIFVQQLWNGLLNGSIYVVFASGLSLVFGVMKVINMAHGELTTLGAMVLFAVTTELGLGYFPALGLVLVTLGLFGMIINRIAVQPLQQRSNLSVLLATIALGYIIVNAVIAIWGTGPRGVDAPFNAPVVIGGLHTTTASLLLIGMSWVAMLGLYLILTKTRLGSMARATGQNLLGAQLLGMNTRRIYDATLFMASALAALSGAVLILISTASSALGQPLLITGFAVVIVAGMGNVGGAIAVGLFLGITEALFGQYISTYYRQGYLYAAMVLALLLRPQGVFGRR